ncbi:hypothetical protein SAMN02910447_02066 [Ruminococcus sp. YE71]|uniref:hypothetical protein n=1 Tax=unclassified Ruminococcus TaxID=2608920 RepID=UPI0008907604|nr:MULTISPECIES: hypothetical protein [unclassified Ruminococcus]SDA21664.1 hypothetical protein SAMN02910446_01935 [Ruminococcus sp. YE78]SFW36621.1 hypothetical protein SAMN02910447_02066 [Ruminococcus sp. YE71]
MKMTRGFIAGMAAMTIALSFAGCGSVSDTEEIAKEVAEAPANAAAAVTNTYDVKTADPDDPDAAVKNNIYLQLAAAQHNDKETYAEAMDRDFLSKVVESSYGEKLDDETWNDLFSESWDGVHDEMKNVKGDYTIDNYTIQTDLTETFDNGKIDCFSFTIKGDDFEIGFVGSVFEFDGKTSAYLNVGAPEDEMYSAQLGNSKTAWNAACEFCCENEVPDGEYFFDVTAPTDDPIAQSISKMFTEVEVDGFIDVVVVDGQPVAARWTKNADDEGEFYPNTDEDNSAEMSTDVQLANSKTMWNAAAQTCYENEIADGEYFFDLKNPTDDVIAQKISEIFADVDITGFVYVDVKDGQPVSARWTKNENDEGKSYPTAEEKADITEE